MKNNVQRLWLVAAVFSLSLIPAFAGLIALFAALTVSFEL